MGYNNEEIDLNKLSQRELLIVVYNKVENLERVNADQIQKQMNTDIDIAVMKSKITTWGATVGFFSGIAGSIIVAIIVEMLMK